MDQAKQLLRSHGGLTIKVSEKAGHESFAIETPDGRKFLIQDSPGVVEISDNNGNSFRLEADGVTISAAAKVTINASAIEINSGIVNVNAAMSQFAGVVKCETLIANNVVSASYSPGAGNIW